MLRNKQQRMFNSSFFISLFSLLLSILLLIVSWTYLKNPNMIGNLLKNRQENTVLLYTALGSIILYRYVFSRSTFVFNGISAISAGILGINMCIRFLVIVCVLQPQTGNYYILFCCFMFLVALNGCFRISIKIGYELSTQHSLYPNIILIRGIIDTDWVDNSAPGGGSKFNINPKNSMHNWTRTGAIIGIVGVAVTVGFGIYNINEAKLNLKIKTQELEIEKEKLKILKEQLEFDKKRFEAKNERFKEKQKKFWE